MASKEQTIRVHARRRFDERYEVNLTDALHKELVLKIQTADQASFICAQSNRVTVWSVEVAAKYMPKGVGAKCVPVAYDKVRKLLVTVLPIGCLDAGQIGLFSSELLA